MTSSELTAKLIETGFIDERFRTIAETEIGNFMKTKGSSEVENALLSRYKPIMGEPSKVLRMILNRLPDKKEQAGLEDDVPLTIAEEIALEKADFKAVLELREELGTLCGSEPKPLTKPNDPKFDKHPSIFDAEPYRSLSQEKQKLYKENTFLSVMDEAEKEHTSMHEICRRKGLVYEALLA